MYHCRLSTSSLSSIQNRKKSTTRRSGKDTTRCSTPAMARVLYVILIMQKSWRTRYYFFDNDRYSMGDFIVMPNHVHLLVTPTTGWQISDLLHSWKRFSARKINERMQQEGKLWQHESYDHIVRNEEQLKRIKKYIKNNSKNLKAGEFLCHEGRTTL